MPFAAWLAKALGPRRKRGQRARRDRERFEARLIIKPLESRTLLSATTELTLDPSGNLIIADAASGGQDDQLTIKSDATRDKIIITDPVNEIGLGSGLVDGVNATVIDEHTIEVNSVSVTGDVVTTLGNGDDNLTVDLSAGDFSQPISYDGGAGTNSLQVLGGPDVETFSVSTSTTHDYRVANDHGSAVDFRAVANLSIAGSANDTIHVNDTLTLSGSTTLDAGAIYLHRDVTGALSGTTAGMVSLDGQAEIQDGVDVAKSGGTVNIAAGTYSGDVIIDKPLSLQGANAGNNPNVTGTRGPEAIVQGNIQIAATGAVEIDGFRIEGGLADPGADLVIENNVIVAPGTAIEITGANSAQIRNNLITAGGDGIYGVGSVFGFGITGDVTIEDNVIQAAGYGVFLDRVTGAVTGRRNKISGFATSGFDVNRVDGDVLLVDNEIKSSTAGARGVYIGNSGTAALATVTLQHNTIDVDGTALWLESVEAPVLIGGTLAQKNIIKSAAGTGVRIDGGLVSGPIDLSNNEITAAGSGVELRDGAGDFTAIGNTIQAGFEAGILINNSVSGDILLRGNRINVANAASGVSISQVQESVTLDGNDLVSDANTTYTVQIDQVRSLVFTNNDVQTSVVGLFVENVADDVTIQANAFHGDGILGLYVSKALGTVQIGGDPVLVGVTLVPKGNTFTGLGLGMNIVDSPDVRIERNVITGAIQGIYAASADQLTLANNSVNSAANGTGIVLDGTFGPTAVTFGPGNVITGGDVGLVMQGAQLSVVGNTLNNLVLNGQALNYIVLQDGALAGDEIDGTAVTYDSPTAPPVVGSDNFATSVGFAIEDRIVHAIDDGSLGFIRVHTGNVYVTPNSFILPNTTQADIQRGINVAVANDTVFVQAGSYNGNLLIDRPITLSGPNEGISAVTGARVPEATILGSVTIATPGDVTITGFTIQDAVRNDAALGDPVLVVSDNFINSPAIGIDVSGVRSALVQNNVIAAGGDGVYGFRIGDSLTVEHNRINSAGFAGIEGQIVGGAVTVRDNELVLANATSSGIYLLDVAGDVLLGGPTAADGNRLSGLYNYGVFAIGLGGTFTARHNTISEATEVGISLVNFTGDATISDNAIAATSSGSSPVQGIYLSNLGFGHTAGATLQGNQIDILRDGMLLEGVRGPVMIGGATAGQENVIKSAAGMGVRIDGNLVSGSIDLVNNQITAAGSGVELRDGTGDFTAIGNTIVAGFEAGILINNSVSGDILLRGNTINVANAAAGVSISQVQESVTLDDNDLVSDANTTYTVQIEQVGSLTFTANDVTTSVVGLFVNGVANGTIIQSNVLHGDGVLGIYLSNALGTTQIGGASAALGNTITGLGLGMNIVDSPDVTIGFNTISGAIQGIYAARVADLTLANNSVTSAANGTGIVLDGSFGPTEVTLGSGNVITGGDVGLVMQGTGMSVTGNTLNNLILNGQAVNYIVLSDGALAGEEINGRGVTYDGLLGDAVNLAQGFFIEDRIVHAIDDGSLGFIRVHSGNVYVTPNSFIPPNTTQADIQRGINVAVANDTVFVQAGSYNGNLLIDRPITLSGPNEGISAVTGARVPEATILGSVTIATPGDVTITGFTIQDAVRNDASRLLLGGPNLIVIDNFITAAGTAIDGSYANSFRVADNQITSGLTGVYGFNVRGPATIQGNTIAAGGRGVELEQIAGTVQIGGATPALQNTIAAGTDGIFAHNLASTFTAQGNAITGVSGVGIEVAQIVGDVLILGNTVDSAVAGSQGIYVSNQGLNSSANATVQGNTVSVGDVGIWLESIRGLQQLGGTAPGEANVVTTAAGTGVRIFNDGVGGVARLENNQITAGGSGVQYLEGVHDFIVRGNTIAAGFEAGLLVSNSRNGHILIGGPNAADGNQITTTGAVAGMELLDIADNLLLQNNHVTSDSSGIVAANIGGTTTIDRNLLDGAGLVGLDLTNAVGTVTISGLRSEGSINVEAQNLLSILPATGYVTPGIDAGAATIWLKANQDGIGSESFVQDTSAPVVTTNDTDLALLVQVGGTGNAQISVLKAGLNDGQVTVISPTNIVDNSADAPVDIPNVEASQVSLIAETGIGGLNNADIDTAVAFLRASTTTGDVHLQELNDIELRSILAPAGSIFVDAGGVLTIQNHTSGEGAALQSKTGKVSNAPPLVRLDEQKINDVILPGDRTQEVVGTYGGIDPPDNYEQGQNFTATVTWADGKTNTVHGLQAGDELIWRIDEDGNGQPEIIRNGPAEGPITVYIQRTYPFSFLQTITGTEVEAQFTLANDPNIVLTDSRYPSVSTFTNLNATAPLSIFTTVSKTDFQPPIVPVEEPPPPPVELPPPPVLLERVVTSPSRNNLYQQTALVRDEATEQQALLYLVRVGPDGEEEQRVLLPLSDLQDIAGLLDRLRKLKMRSGLYRIYHQEPGLPPRKVLEFRKAGNFIGDPVREPGRGANPLESQPGGQTPGSGATDKGAAEQGQQNPQGAERPNSGRDTQDKNSSLPQQRSDIALALAEATDRSFTKAARLRRALQRAAMAK